MIAVPTGEQRRIDDMGVFATTAIFSIFAYVWMLIVLVVWSPNEVELVEAILTLVFFVVLILLAFGADKYNSIKKRRLEEKNLIKKTDNKVANDAFYRILEVNQGQRNGTVGRKSVIPRMSRKDIENQELMENTSNNDESKLTTMKTDSNNNSMHRQNVISKKVIDFKAFGINLIGERQANERFRQRYQTR